MKKLLLTMLFVLIAFTANAQCVPIVKDVLIDEVYGSIIVETEYELNGVVVDVDTSPCWLEESSGKHFITLIHPKTKQPYNKECIGQSRYTERTGTISEIVTKAKADIRKHRDFLIIANAVKVSDLKGRQLIIKKALTEPLISTLRTNAIGWSEPSSQVTFNFKNKEITVNADGTYSVTDAP